jgi:hypothetical protein
VSLNVAVERVLIGRKIRVLSLTATTAAPNWLRSSPGQLTYEVDEDRFLSLVTGSAEL